jgi:hypothetical protein
MGYLERNAGIVITLLLSVGLLFCVFFAELLAQRFGLGAVVAYEVNPLYGYRPGPNQNVTRHTATVSLNDQGLRTDDSWESNPSSTKVLFLGDSITYGGSYIDNSELFSTLSTKSLPNITSANAGVNGWGVSNVSGLVVDYGFTPADIYISTFPEEDFIRGLNRVSGSPFWPAKPQYALSELWHYLLYKLSLKKYDRLNYPLTEQEWTQVKRKAVSDLKRLHTFLLSQGFKHKIFITPTKKQAKGEAEIDNVLKQLLLEADLPVIYLQEQLHFAGDIDSFYHDAAHLSVPGHAKWATVYQEAIQSMLLEDA